MSDGRKLTDLEVQSAAEKEAAIKKEAEQLAKREAVELAKREAAEAAKRESGKAKLQSILNEFYEKQAGFHATMNELVLKVSPCSQLLTGEDKKWFQIYLEPYKKLGHSSFKDPGFHQDPKGRLEAIIQGGVRAKKEYDLTPMSKLPKSGPAANKLYMEFVNDELVYQAQAQVGPDPVRDAIKVHGSITKLQFATALGASGAGRVDAIFETMKDKGVSAIQPFLNEILSITTLRGHTQEYEANFLFTKLLQEELDAIKQAIFNYDNFRQFLNKIIALPVVSKNADALAALETALAQQVIVPVQYGPRYQLLLQEIIRHIPGDSPYLEPVNNVCAQIVTQLKSVNEQIRRYENIGTCYLAMVDTIPMKDNRKEGIIGNLDQLGLPTYSFVRVKNEELDQLYYVNKEKDQVILVGDAAKDSDFIKQFDSKIKFSPDSPKSKSKTSSSLSSGGQKSQMIRKLDSKELKAIVAMNLNFHEVREAESEVRSQMERAFDKSRTSVMLDEQLLHLIMGIQLYIDNQPQTDKLDSSMEKLVDLVAKLKLIQKEELADNKRMDLVREEIMQPYADLYVDERTKTWTGGTHKGKTLAYLEDILEKSNLGAAKSVQEESVSLMKDTPDARIFRSFEYSPANSMLVAEQLFKRAMTEGVCGEQDIDIYVNARKAINRMGMHAINRWNELAIQKFEKVDPNFFIAGSSGSLEDEGQIRAGYRKIMANQEVGAAIDRMYYIRILINTLKEGFPNKEIIAKLDALEKKQDLEKVDVSALVHRAVMDVYVSAGLMTRGSGLFGASPKELNLMKLQDTLREFQSRSGNELFGRLNFNEKITDKIMHEAILGSVATSKEESYDFAKRVFEHALHFGFMPSASTSANEKSKVEAMNKKIYTTDVRAIIQMGETAIKAWNELAVKSSPNPKVWANLLIQRTNRGEDNIGKLHAALTQNPAFLVHAKQRRGADNEVEPSQLQAQSLREQRL